MKKLKIICYFLFYLVHSSPIYADTITIDASIKMLHFNYEEFDQLGKTFNKETGFISGLSLTATKPVNNFTNSFSFEGYDGQVNYDGMTQSGIPLESKTNETINRLFYKLDWSPETSNSSIYGKISWQQWDRDILSTATSSRLFEQYRWWALEAGFSISLYSNKKSSWLFEFGVLKTTHGMIEINLSRQGFGKPELRLGSGSGINTSLLYQYTINEQSEISFGIQVQRWKFGRSNTRTVSNNFLLIDITEPKSQSSHTSLSIIYRYHF